MATRSRGRGGIGLAGQRWAAGLAVLLALASGCRFDVDGLAFEEEGGVAVDAPAAEARAQDGEPRDAPAPLDAGPGDTITATDAAGTDGNAADAAPQDAPPGADAPPPCGNAGEDCCSGNTCLTSDLRCSGGTCEHCGDEGEQCCAGDACGAEDLRCSGGACEHCGAAGERCCPGSKCPDCGWCICGPISGYCW
ncbi:MAG: hypothetical protein HY906_21880 [Deltaproteobacteria bacterium]|nr:hypothetical protein [Deltaproteobacteria bacterium]